MILRCIYVVICCFVFVTAFQAQQSPNPEVHYEKPKTIREIIRLSLAEQPDSADLYAIFTPKYAKRPQYYFNVNACYWKRLVAKDSLSIETANTPLKEIQVHTYTPIEYASKFTRKLDSLSYMFVNPKMLIHDIDRGDGSHWAYFARYRTYVNNHWISLSYDLWFLLMAIHDSDLEYWSNEKCKD